MRKNQNVRTISKIILLLIATVSCKKVENISKFRSDFANSGIYSVQSPLKIKAVAWKFKTNGYVFSSPVISGNSVFVGSNDSFVYAINSTDGKLKWKFKTNGVVSSSPAIYQETVYILSFDGNLYALNAQTGEKKWGFFGGTEKQYTNHGIHGLQPKNEMMADPWDMYLSSPNIYKGKVFFGSGSGMFFAVDAQTGKEVWKFSTPDVIHTSPAIFEDKVIFGGWDTFLHALNTETGKEIWKFATGVDTAVHNQTGIQSSPAVYNGTIYFGCRDANLYALDGKTGKLKWKKYNNGSWVINTPVIKDSILYYGTSDTHKIWALNANNGDSIFQTDLQAYIFSSPVIAGNTLFAGDFSGCFFAIDTKTGTKTWTYRTEASTKNEYKVLDNKGYIPNSFFDTYFKDGPTFANNAKVMKALYSLGSFLSTPSVADGTVYVGSSDGFVYAFR